MDRSYVDRTFGHGAKNTTSILDGTSAEDALGAMRNDMESEVVANLLDFKQFEADVQRSGELRIAVPDLKPPPLDEDTATEIAEAVVSAFQITVRLQLTDASRKARVTPRADIMGISMAPDVKFRVRPGRRLSIYAWTSHVKLILEGPAVLLNESTVWKPSLATTPRVLAEYHVILHAARQAAQQKAASALETEQGRNAVSTSPLEYAGPRVLVCGGPGSGKWGAVTTLVNYATRLGWSPLVMDFDPGRQEISIPGAIGGSVIELPIMHRINGEPRDIASVTLPYFVGTSSAQRTANDAGVPESFCNGMSVDGRLQLAAQQLISLAVQRLASHAGNVSGSTGCFVRVPPLRGLDGVHFVKRVIEDLSVTHVLCLGDDFMFHQLRESYRGSAAPDANGQVLFSTKMGTPLQIDRICVGTGPSRPSNRVRRDDMLIRWQEYFEAPHLLLQRHTGRISSTGATSSLQVFRAVSSDDSGAGGPTVQRASLIAVSIDRLDEIIGRIGAVIDLMGEASTPKAPVIGFCHLLGYEVDGDDVVLQYRTPLVDNSLPKGYAIVVGELRWSMVS